MKYEDVETNPRSLAKTAECEFLVLRTGFYRNDYFYYSHLLKITNTKLSGL